MGKVDGMSVEEGPRARKERYSGLIGRDQKEKRRLVFAMSVLAIFVLVFMQFGFIGVGRDGSYEGYVFGLLIPVCATALTLGTLDGMIMGLIAGVMQSVHAYLMPLDIFERYFVNIVTCPIFYALIGLLLGLFFKVALRNNPQGARRYVYIALVSGGVSLITSILFIVMAVMGVVLYLFVGTVEKGYVLASDVYKSFIAIGDLILQMAFDFVILFLVSTGIDVYLKKFMRDPSERTLRDHFRTTLGFVSVSVFLLVSAVCFFMISIHTLAAERDRLNGEIEYASSLILHELDDTALIARELGDIKLSDPTITDEHTCYTYITDGYDLKSDGTFVTFETRGEDLVVTSSNNPAYPVGVMAEDIFGFIGGDASRQGDALESGISETLSQVAEQKASMKTYFDGVVNRDEMAQTIYDTFPYEPADRAMLDRDATSELHTQIGYMRVGRVPRHENVYVMMALPSTIVFASRSTIMLVTTITVFLLLAVIAYLIWRLLGSNVVEPIEKTNRSLGRICEGDLDEVVTVKNSLEFKALSFGINTTVGVLKELISESERRMEKDLETAKTIQESALPSTFPPFPESSAFDIYASMNAAKEVGGDFYDFYLLDDHTLIFLIADVSGKGIPGALFMMAAKSELESFISTGMDLAEAIKGANLRLCNGNDAGMFVTVWAASFDFLTGELTYLNAGHNPPLVRHNGEWRWLKDKGGLFLGTFERAKYRTSTLHLEEGDQLLLYTDGVNEAFNVNEEEYGNDRLEEFLMSHADLGPKELVEALRADVKQWAEGAEQSDDITMLALDYGISPEVTGTVMMKADDKNLHKAFEFIDAELENRLCPPSVKNRIDVAFEELFVNVCHYAYADKEEMGDVEVSYSFDADTRTYTIRLRDWGIPFDPVTREDPTLPATVQEAKIGGLGIMMTKRSVDKLTYKYVDGANVTTFSKSW